MDWSLYWFMLPVAIFVSTSAMASGIGGAALFMPIFVIVLPWLGPEYTLDSVATATLVSLITMSFSFTSGVSLYAYKRAINYKIAIGFLKITVPVALLAAWFAPLFQDWILLGIYTLTILGVSYSILGKTRPSDVKTNPKPNIFMTAIGAFTTGASSVGIGEMTMPQLMKRPMGSVIITGTSVFIVFATVIASSSILTLRLSNQPNVAIPWNIICYTVPGVVIGAQIGPRIHSKISDKVFRKVIAYLFIAIAIAMASVILKKTNLI